MSLHGRPKGETPPWGDGAQRQGGNILSLHGRPKGEIPPWGDGAQRQGGTL